MNDELNHSPSGRIRQNSEKKLKHHNFRALFDQPCQYKRFKADQNPVLDRLE